MSKLKHVAIAGMIIAFLSYAAHADDLRCSTPPYGGTVIKFQAFVKNFGQIVVPATFLQKICNAKYSEAPGGKQRMALYNLGFTDEQIDAKDTEDFAVDVFMALGNLADKTK